MKPHRSIRKAFQVFYREDDHAKVPWQSSPRLSTADEAFDEVFKMRGDGHARFWFIRHYLDNGRHYTMDAQTPFSSQAELRNS